MKTIWFPMFVLLFYNAAQSLKECDHTYYKVEIWSNSKTLYINCLKNCDDSINSCQMTNCNLHHLNISDLVTKNCSSKDLLAFIDANTNISLDSVTILEFNLYSKEDKTIKLSQGLFEKFPSLCQIHLRHADLKLIGSEIECPINFNQLIIYRSNQAQLPIIIGSNITKLKIDMWPNLRNISRISNFKNLESFALKSKQEQMIDLPENIFSKNDKLKELFFNGISPIWNSNSFIGLNSLTKITFWGCNFTAIPDRLFANTPGLKELIWEYDVCPASRERIMPNHMLDGTGITKFVYHQKYQK